MRGLAAFLLAFALYALLRDWLLSRTIADDVIEFGRGVVPWLADFMAAFSLMLALLLVQIARGDPRRELLARSGPLPA